MKSIIIHVVHDRVFSVTPIKKESEIKQALSQIESYSLYKFTEEDGQDLLSQRSVNLSSHNFIQLVNIDV